ncbi:MAG TPA: glycosyltransferase family 39 protein [Casimicrobiaceae bacterium]|nr:glycosyltransferase family 39 protein [Casimicrobiaceae bacterium]
MASLAPSRSLSAPESIAAYSRRAWILLAILAAIAWFANLDVRKLQHPDEGRYAEIAREMIASGDWITPRLNGIKYFEKPPLQYWLTAASFEAFELDEWTARLPSALAGFLTILVVAYAGAIVASPAIGAYAATALAGFVWPFGISHMVTLDALLTFWLALALGAFLVAQHHRADARRQRAWMLVAWAATAGGVMTKGLVAIVIPFCTLVIHSLVTGDRRPWSRLALGRGLALFLLLSAPWFLIVSARNPEFARFFFIHEHFERFLTTEHRRIGAWWYFLPLLAIGLLPWTGVFLWGIRQNWRSESGTPAFAWKRFCLIWCAFILVFFSVSGSKLPSYILPIFPAAALVLGATLDRMRLRTLAAFAALIATTTSLLWLGALIGWSEVIHAFADARTPAGLLVALGTWVKLALGIATGGYLLACFILRREDPRAKTAGIVTLSFATMLTMQAVYTGSDVFRATRSAADFVTRLQNANDPPYDASAPFFQVRMYDQTLPFYLERTTTLVQYRDELGPGLDSEPSRAIARESDWFPQWRALSQGYAMMAPDTYAEFAAVGIPMRVIASDARRVLVARR